VADGGWVRQHRCNEMACRLTVVSIPRSLVNQFYASGMIRHPANTSQRVRILQPIDLEAVSPLTLSLQCQGRAGCLNCWEGCVGKRALGTAVCTIICEMSGEIHS